MKTGPRNDFKPLGGILTPPGAPTGLIVAVQGGCKGTAQSGQTPLLPQNGGMPL